MMFWIRWRDVLLIGALGLVLVEYGDHGLAKIGTFSLAAAITVWILRVSRRIP